MKAKIWVAAVLILVGLWAANQHLNAPRSSAIGTDGLGEEAGPGGGRRALFAVGFLPVTCHLTCPVTSWVTRHSDSGTLFEARRFGDFASMKEALIARKLDATFMIAPLAMKLVADGVPVKIVYLGHRDGTALAVGKASQLREFEDLAGKRVAIPSRFSNQNLLMARMMKKHGMPPGSIELVEMPPPDMPAALAARAIDGYIVGEPHPSRAELDGYGRILYLAKDLWPDFISCVLVVRQEVINERRELVAELVSGIARSGKWLDADREQGASHRKAAAVVVGRMYYNQDPALLEYVLTKPLDRVSYTDLEPTRKAFDEIMELAIETGVLPRTMRFDEYCDTSFAPDLATVPETQGFPLPTAAELAEVGGER